MFPKRVKINEAELRLTGFEGCFQTYANVFDSFKYKQKFVKSRSNQVNYIKKKNIFSTNIANEMYKNTLPRFCLNYSFLWIADLDQIYTLNCQRPTNILDFLSLNFLFLFETLKDIS